MKNKNKKTIAVISAHPDDESLGCGGTIARHIQMGDEVYVLILAEGITSRDANRKPEQRASELSELSRNAQEANKILGVTSLTIKPFPDNRMDSVEFLDVVKEVESFLQEHRPSIVYTHHEGDLNLDHRLVHKAVAVASRPRPDNSVKTILFYEVPSSTEWQIPSSSSIFIPNWFVNIEDTLNKKLKALTKYHTERRPWPHARSVEAIEHLARWRGASVGLNAAEAFMLGRNIDNLDH